MYFRKLDSMGESGCYPVAFVSYSLGLITLDWMLPAYVAGMFVGLVWLFAVYYAIKFAAREGVQNLGTFFHNCLEEIIRPLYLAPYFSYCGYGMGYWVAFWVQRIMPNA
ncbi:hypothetical protein KUV95_03505 [Microbulbifer agarilyticus]|uniref:hypothetical protein n=1 Tax=Microbulbifer agarilyticus TaxID=260552 RepID=UPI001C9399F4|nr:hypothetical protein [Microbulbifer agarilyticus]MBY6210604.1 hypothetical protein [Microbulbifer agarilyticus]